MVSGVKHWTLDKPDIEDTDDYVQRCINIQTMWRSIIHALVGDTM